MVPEDPWMPAADENALTRMNPQSYILRISNSCFNIYFFCYFILLTFNDKSGTGTDE
jgi:hypothetical protein